MLKIGICDDDAKQRKQIENWIEKELFQYTELEIIQFSSGEEIVAAIDNNNFDVQLLVLDIHMKQINGIDTAAYVRRMRLDIDIIFITVSQKHVYDGYAHKAYAYLIKPVEELSFRKILHQYVTEWMEAAEYLELNSHGELKRINLKNVCYVTSDIRMIEVHMQDRIERYYGKLDEVDKQIGSSGFIRCHKSYLVNAKLIESKAREYLIIQGERIPVSRYYYQKLRDEGFYKANYHSEYKRKSLAATWPHTGAIIGVKGKYTGTIIRIKANQKIMVGRDPDMVDIVLDDIAISRKHCKIEYSDTTQTYSICDVSSNGVLVNETFYLPKGEEVTLNKGDELRFGDTLHVFKLG